MVGFSMVPAAGLGSMPLAADPPYIPNNVRNGPYVIYVLVKGFTHVEVKNSGCMVDSEGVQPP